MKKSDLFFGGFLVLAFLSFSAVSLQAQTYPSHPVQFVIPMTPGDMTDLTGRALASELTKILKTSVIPINKPGGGATMGADFVAKAMKEFVEYMNQNPGKVRVSTTGVGGVGHFNHEVIRLETKTDSTMIPYKGASPALTALLGGHVEAPILSAGLVTPHMKAGKLRALVASVKH